MEKKKVALVFGITNNYFFALANTLIGLLKHNKEFWDTIIVYCDGATEENKKIINKITKCEFKDFKNKEISKDIPQEIIKKYSVACLYRYDCFNLLNEYETVIWNDVDILIQGDISGLCNYVDKGLALTQSNANFKNEANFLKLIPEYDMLVPLYNSGIMVLKDTLPNYQLMYSWCVSKTIELGNILRWPDQGIINLLIQEFNIDLELIDIEKYCCHPILKEKIKNASIIHAYGDAKFWNDDQLKLLFPEWRENEKKWKKLSAYNTSVDENILISCIMSTYNRYEFLEESVLSILNQTYKNFELIIVLEKCENQNKIEKLLKTVNDERIIIIKNPDRLGFAESLNIGIDYAKGKYIARMDDDDISLPDRFEEQIKFMEKNQEIAICGTKGQFFGKYNGLIDVETDSNILKIITLFKTPFIHPSVMMRKDMLNKYNLRYNKDYFTEDYELWSRAVKHLKFGNIDKVLLKYRSGQENLTNGSNENKMHNSHKKIMFNQFKNYLNLELSNDELETIQGRKDIFINTLNREAIINLRNQTIKKILEANEKEKFYPSDKLNSIFKFENKNIQSKSNLFNKIIKKICKPLYIKLMARVESKIVEHEIAIHEYYDKEIVKIYKEIDK